jgi:hypothetical protein
MVLMSDEARRLLERFVYHSEDCRATVTNIESRCDCAPYEEAEAFLAQPIPAAREVVLAEALEGFRLGPDESPNHFVGCRAYFESHGECSPQCKKAWDALSDTSLAAAALLAQGERLRRFTQAVEQHDWLALIDIAGLANAGEDGLLVNYEVEGDYEGDARYVWPKRLDLLVAAARAALAPGEEKE